MKDADDFRAFIKTVFNAEKKLIIRHPDGSVMHAASKLNGGRILFGQANDRWPPFPAPMYLVTEHVNELYT